MTKPDFAKGVYAKKVQTPYGELINLEINTNLIDRNYSVQNEDGHDIVYCTLKTSKDGNLYAVMNYYGSKKKR